MVSTVNVGVLCLAVAAFLFAGVATARAEWRRLDSPNFVVVGDVGAADLREITRRFESFREVLARVLTEKAVATAVPTVVLVFPSDRAFTPFKPKFNGKPVELERPVPAAARRQLHRAGPRLGRGDDAHRFS